jgi:hypothetical protein
MSWITITVADIAPRLSDDELTALHRATDTTGEPDPLPVIIAQVIPKVRRAVAAGGGTLGAGATIPDELLDSAIAIIRHRLLNGLPGALITEDRRKEYADAIAELDAIAKDAAGIVAPTTPATDTIEAGGVTPSYSETDPPGGPRNFTRSNQEGI